MRWARSPVGSVGAMSSVSWRIYLFSVLDRVANQFMFAESTMRKKEPSLWRGKPEGNTRIKTALFHCK